MSAFCPSYSKSYVIDNRDGEDRGWHTKSSMICRDGVIVSIQEHEFAHSQRVRISYIDHLPCLPVPIVELPPEPDMRFGWDFRGSYGSIGT